MKFGIPNQRTVKKEKYPKTAVMTLNVAGAKGTARTMVFNPKACEVLGLSEDDAKIAFSFDNGIFVLDGTQVGVPEEYGIKVTKNTPRRISDKKTYEYITKVLDLDNSVENEFQLYPNPELVADGGPTIFSLKLMSDVIEDNIKDEEVAVDNFSMEKEVVDNGDSLMNQEAPKSEAFQQEDFKNELADINVAEATQQS